MKILTKELDKDLELFDLCCVLGSEAPRSLPVIFLDGNCEGVAKHDVKTVKTNFNLPDKDNEFRFMLLPSTFEFLNDYDDDEEEIFVSPENDFLSQYVNRLRVISYLPEDILKQVKDKRLLAFGYADKKVKKAISEYAQEKSGSALEILQKSIKDSEAAVSGLTLEKQFAEHRYINSMRALFGEATVTGVRKTDNDICIQLDGRNVIALTDAETIEEEINPERAYIRHYELHNTGNGYELHFLLRTRDDQMEESFHYVSYAFKDMRLN